MMDGEQTIDVEISRKWEKDEKNGGEGCCASERRGQRSKVTQRGRGAVAGKCGGRWQGMDTRFPTTRHRAFNFWIFAHCQHRETREDASPVLHDFYLSL
jgi:hypothetical protein